MGQYKTGKANVTNGSTAVVITGSPSLVGQAKQGDIFGIQGESIWYDIQAVAAGGLTLATPYQGATGNGKNYAIVKSFTPRGNIPYPEAGDVGTASIVRRALIKLAQYAVPTVIEVTGARTVSPDERGCTFQLMGAHILTLPTAVSVEEGWHINVKNHSGSTATLARQGTDQINATAANLSVPSAAVTGFQVIRSPTAGRFITV